MTVEKVTPLLSKKGAPLRKRRALLILLCTVIFGILILLLLPVLLKQGLVSFLKTPLREEVAIEDIDFNPFTGVFLLKGVVLQDKEGNGISFNKGGFRVDWIPLFDRRLRITELRVEKGRLDLAERGEGWLIGGFSAESYTQGKEVGGEGWEWRIETVELRNFTLRYRDPLLAEEIEIDRLDVERLGTIERENGSRFVLSAKLHDATFEMRGEGRFFGENPGIKGYATLRDFPARTLEPYVKGEGVKSFDGKGGGEVTISASFPDEAPIQLEIEGSVALQDGKIEFPFGILRSPGARWDGVLTWSGQNVGDAERTEMKGVLFARDADLLLEDAGLHFSLETLRFEGALDTREEVTIAGAVETKGARIDDTGKGLNLYTSAQLDANGIALSGDLITVKEIDSSGAKMFQRLRALSPSHIFEMERLLVSDARYRGGRRLEVGGVEISGGLGRIDRDAQGNLDIVEWFDRPEKKNESSNPKETTLLLKGVRLVGENRLLVKDETLRPPYTESIRLLSGELASIDSAVPVRPSPVSLHLRIGKYGDLDLAGSLTPFAIEESMNLKGKMRSFDLPSVSAYARRSLDYVIRQGHLDAEIDWSVHKGIIDSKISFVAGKLQIEPVTKNGSKRFEQILGLPVQTTLSLLRDRDDNIRLRLLLDGRLADPNFSVRDLFAKATRTAVQKAAFSYFAPMGVTLLTGLTLPPGTLYVAGKVVDWATTLRFDPVLFVPGESEIGTEGREYLDKMSQLLADRPRVRVVLCGKTSWSDLGIEGDWEKTPLSETETERLIELAGERAVAVKDALIERGIDIDRILICAPVIEPDSSGSPRVDISL